VGSEDINEVNCKKGTVKPVSCDLPREQSNLSHVTFQGNSEIWSHKTVFFLSSNTGLINMKCIVTEIKIEVKEYKLLLKQNFVFITFDYISHTCTSTYFEIRKLLHNNKTYWHKIILKKKDLIIM